MDLALFILTTLSAVAAILLTNEFKSWAPRLAELLVQLAARRLPTDLQPRFDEEWRGVLDEVPGDLSKLFFAGGCLVASARIAAPRTIARASDRLVNIAVAGSALVLLGPAIFLLVLVAKLGTRGSVLERRQVLGLNGRAFFLLRLRTSHEIAKGARSSASAVGTFLYRSALSELPMLINLVRGDMNIIGPRPLTPEQASILGNSADAYLSVRPGLAGAGSLVSGGLEEKIAAELEYVRTRKFSLDLSIFVRVAGVVFTTKGFM